MKKTLMISVATAGAFALAACGETATSPTEGEAANPITAEEVAAAQQAWGDGIVAIGQVFTDEGDYSARAQEHIGHALCLW